MTTHLTHSIGDRGLTTLAMADAIETERDRATERDDERMASARGGPHRYTEWMLGHGWCDTCGVARAVHQ
jgi:hypothetical protein